MRATGVTRRCPAGTNSTARPAAGGCTWPRVDAHSALVSSSLADAAGLTGLDGVAAGAQVKRQCAHCGAAGREAAARAPCCAATRNAPWREAAANGYVAVAEMAAPHMGSTADLRIAAGVEQPGNDPAARPCRRCCRTGASWPRSAEHARSILDGLGVPVLGLAGDLNIDGSIGSRTAALRDGLQRRPGGARQPLPLRGRSRRPPGCLFRSWASRPGSTSLATPDWTRPWMRWTWPRPRWGSSGSGPPATASNMSKWPMPTPSPGWPSTR